MCVTVLLKKKRAAGSRHRKRWLVWSLQRTDASVAAAAQRHLDLRSSLTDTGVTTEEGANRLRPLDDTFEGLQDSPCPAHGCEGDQQYDLRIKSMVLVRLIAVKL